MADEIKIDSASINQLADAIVTRTGTTGKGVGSQRTGTSFTGAIKGVEGFAQATLTAGASLQGLTGAITSATKNVPILGTFTHGLSLGIGVIEETADVYRTLSKVGAGASGSLFDLRIQSAQARLPLDQFAGMVTRNSELLAGFAGGVEGGSQTLAKVGQTLFGETRLIENFTNLGYSIEEATEMTLKSMAMDRRAAALEGRSAAEQTAEAARYAKSLQVISKLTGKQADQLQDEMQAQMADGAVRAKMRMLEKQGITGATEANKQAMEGMAGASSAQKLAMKEILTLGAPVSEAAKNFVAANGAAAELMYEAKAAIESGDAEGAKKASEKSLAAAIESGDSMTNLQLATLKSVSDFGATQAQALEETAAIVDQTIIAQKKAAENNTKFATLGETFLGTLEKLNTGVNRIAEGTQAGGEALGASNRINEGLVDAGAQAQEALAKGAKGSADLAAGLQAIDDMDTTQVVDGFTGAVKDATATLTGTLNETASEQKSILNDLGMIDAAKLVDTYHRSTDEAEKTAAKQKLIEDGVMDQNMKLTQTILDAQAKLLQNTPNATTNNLPPGSSEISEGDSNPLADILKSINKLIPDALRETGGPLGSNQLALVGEGGPELFMSNTAGRIFPNDVTQSLATLGPELGQKFSEISQQLAQEMQTMGAPMTEAAQVAAANMTAPDSASNPDLIKMMQQLVEVNRKSMDIQKSHLSQYKSALKGI